MTERLQAHLQAVARERDPYLATEGHFYVRQYVRQELARWGTVQTQAFTHQGRSYQNLIVDLPGQRRDRAPILIGAHYDAVPGSPGADDNATGVAVLLELARQFAATPARHPVRLVAFDLEETQYEWAGSTHYARSLQGEPLRLMLSLEMLGYCSSRPNSQQYPLPALRYLYPTVGNFIGLIGNVRSLPDLWRLSRAMRQAGTPCEWLPMPQQGRPLPDTRRSDHAVFWDLGYRALMVTDTAMLRNPNYHQPSDRIETLDLTFLSQVCWGLFQGVRQL